ncbi:MAG: VanW family protein [bacterium]
MEEILQQKILQFKQPHRQAFSRRYPLLLPLIIFVKRLLKRAKNWRTIGRPLKKADYLPCVAARHSSLLYRKLGSSDPALQIGKVHNLKLAVARIDRIVIRPGKTFSFWHQIGSTGKRQGYVDGLVLSNGIAGKGVGGGLCQLANFLYWIVLHTDVEIVERHHHSIDAFPDSGRTLPFGSGATVFHNYIDLQIKNVSQHPLQIKLWFTDECLKGQILSDVPQEKKFHVIEKNHCFVRSGTDVFRYNELYRETRVKGELVKEEQIVVNFAPVKYALSTSENVIQIS